MFHFYSSLILANTPISPPARSLASIQSNRIELNRLDSLVGELLIFHRFSDSTPVKLGRASANLHALTSGPEKRA